MDEIRKSARRGTAKWLSFAAVAATGAVALAATETSAAAPDNRPVVYSHSIAFGAYDPWGDFANDRNVKIEAIFLPWQDVDLATLRAADGYARERGRSVLISVEPWTWSKTDRISPPALLKGILA